MPRGFMGYVIDVRSGGFCGRGNISLGTVIHTTGSVVGGGEVARNNDAVAVRLTQGVCLSAGGG